MRIATAINTLLISGIYLVAQLVGAGAVIEALACISFSVAVLICGVFMVVTPSSAACWPRRGCRSSRP